MNPNQQPPQNPQNYGNQPQQTPQSPGGYGPQPAQTYAVDYLDQIAPPPGRKGFMSGGFGKIIVVLGVVFVLAVSLIIALGNQKNTASTEKIAVRLENMITLTRDFKRHIKSGNLSSTNSNFQTWLTNTKREADDLLVRAEVKPTSFDKKMVSDEKQAKTDMAEKLENARLTGSLDRVYAREMAFEAQKLVTEFNTMAKKGPAKAFKEFATTSNNSLIPLQKAFEDFDESKD
jgi:hypothetical protein